MHLLQPCYIILASLCINEFSIQARNWNTCPVTVIRPRLHEFMPERINIMQLVLGIKCQKFLQIIIFHSPNTLEKFLISRIIHIYRFLFSEKLIVVCLDQSISILASIRVLEQCFRSSWWHLLTIARPFSLNEDGTSDVQVC